MVEYAVVALAPLRCVAYSGEDVLEALHAGVNVVDGLPQEAEGFERISWECASGRDLKGGVSDPRRGRGGKDEPTAAVKRAWHSLILRLVAPMATSMSIRLICGFRKRLSTMRGNELVVPRSDAWEQEVVRQMRRNERCRERLARDGGVEVLKFKQS